MGTGPGGGAYMLRRHDDRVSRRTEKVGSPRYRRPALDRQMDLERFAVGKSNRMAFRAAEAIARTPGKKYSPFFVVGGSGVGKSHLGQGICRRICSQFPAYLVIYMTGQQFQNRCMQSLRNGDLDRFRCQLHRADCLCLDGVDCFSGKQVVQTELRHAFEAIHNRNRQIVFSSVIHPRHMKDVGSKLKSLFLSGLVVEIQNVDYETRLDILSRRMHEELHLHASDVLEYLARHTSGGVRELLSAYTALLAYGSLAGAKVDIPLARRVLREMDAKRDRKPGFDAITQAVARQFDISTEAILSSSRAQPAATARQIAIYLVREWTGLSLREIADRFSRKCSTVSAAAKKVKDRSGDPRMRDALEAIRIALGVDEAPYRDE